MVLGTSYITIKYVDVNKCCDGNGINGITNITSQIKEGTTKQNLKVILDDVALESVNSTKFLGVIIDEHLTWKNHIDAISKTISRSTVVFVRSLKWNSMYLDIYYTHNITLVLPHINYGILMGEILVKPT